jgi:large subunit ribosomal protein L17
MRHLNTGRKLSRSGSHRKALLRNMVTSLLREERIKTTDAKAKEVRRVAERIITLGRKGTQHARRLAFETIRDTEVLGKLFDVLGPRFKERHGGYTRILKFGRRAGDNAPLSILELVERAPKEKKPEAGKKAAEPAAAEAGHEGHDHK